MKVYIAGKLQTPNEREILEKVDTICKSLGLETFLPHRDVGFAKSYKDSKKIFEGDIIAGFKNCSLVIACLDGLHIGAGTAWELGYAYARKIPSLGLKTDEAPEEAFEYLSAILYHSLPIVSNFEDLKKNIKKLLKINQEV
jgi:nucleoside 2-deoxyribosyltransferase